MEIRIRTPGDWDDECSEITDLNTAAYGRAARSFHPPGTRTRADRLFDQYHEILERNAKACGRAGRRDFVPSKIRTDHWGQCSEITDLDSKVYGLAAFRFPPSEAVEIPPSHDEEPPPAPSQIRIERGDGVVDRNEAANNDLADESEGSEAGYELGQDLIRQSHSLPFASSSQASALLLRLPLRSPLFAKRTSGGWTYAVLVDRLFDDDRGGVSLVVHLDGDGSNKKILERSKWARCLRLVKGHVASEVLLAVDGADDCAAGAGEEEEDAAATPDDRPPLSATSRDRGGRLSGLLDRHIDFDPVVVEAEDAVVATRPAGRIGAKLAGRAQGPGAGGPSSPEEGGEATVTTATVSPSLRSEPKTPAEPATFRGDDDDSEESSPPDEPFRSSILSAKSASFHGDTRAQLPDEAPAAPRLPSKSVSFHPSHLERIAENDGGEGGGPPGGEGGRRRARSATRQAPGGTRSRSTSSFLRALTSLNGPGSAEVGGSFTTAGSLGRIDRRILQC